MKSHCRFLRVKAGISYFAQVEVEVQPGTEEVEIVYSLPDKVDFREGEANFQTAPSWVEAALEGIHDALDFARQAGVLATGCRVELIKLGGTVADTRADVVRCAAGLATVQGLGLPGITAEPEFDGKEWGLRFAHAGGMRNSEPPQPVRWAFRTPVQKPEWQAHNECTS